MNKRRKQLLTRLLVTAAIPLAGLVFVFITMTPEGPMNGAELYELHCRNCHGAEGEGLRGLYPPLAGADYLEKHQAELPCMLRHGMSGPILVNGKEYNQVMPGVERLTATEVWKIMDFINHAWGNDIPTAPKEKVKVVLKRCPGQ